jgi:hypothetical protein
LENYDLIYELDHHRAQAQQLKKEKHGSSYVVPLLVLEQNERKTAQWLPEMKAHVREKRFNRYFLVSKGNLLRLVVVCSCSFFFVVVVVVVVVVVLYFVILVSHSRASALFLPKILLVVVFVMRESADSRGQSVLV